MARTTNTPRRRDSTAVTRQPRGGRGRAGRRRAVPAYWGVPCVSVIGGGWRLVGWVEREQRHRRAVSLAGPNDGRGCRVPPRVGAPDGSSWAAAASTTPEAPHGRADHRLLPPRGAARRGGARAPAPGQ